MHSVFAEYLIPIERIPGTDMPFLYVIDNLLSDVATHARDQKSSELTSSIDEVRSSLLHDMNMAITREMLPQRVTGGLRVINFIQDIEGSKTLSDEVVPSISSGAWTSRIGDTGTNTGIFVRLSDTDGHTEAPEDRPTSVIRLDESDRRR